jgi:RNA polymerase sigma-70 factor (ECF subfamily)
LRRENARRFERKQLDYSDVEQDSFNRHINPALEQAHNACNNNYCCYRLNMA